MRSEKIIIVEDEKIIALDLQRRLERFGFQVIGLFSDGKKLLENIERLGPDIVLMDIMLAGEIDGIDAAISIKNNQRTPVIFLTAYADEKTLERAKEAEPFGYILKPFKEKELYTTIDIALYKSSMDKKLVSQERWLTAILHSIGDGIIATDTANKISYMNTVAETVIGIPEEEAKGKDLADVFIPHDDDNDEPLDLTTLISGDIFDSPLLFDNVHIKSSADRILNIEGSVSVIHDKSTESEGFVLAFRDITDVRRMSATISFQASHDTLTGLLNRDELFYKLKELSTAQNNDPSHHTFLYLDIDQFKIVNDVCGHLAGDELLQEIADNVNVFLKDHHLFGRLGGDEFGIILLNTSIPEAEKMALAILKLVQRKFNWQNQSITVQASIGIVPITHKSLDVYSILAAADDACYLAKEEGGNRIKLYKPGDKVFTQRRGEMQWISRLTDALEKKQFKLMYQTISPLKEEAGLPLKKELLLRLQTEEGGIISPADFIPAAERYKLMSAIDRWVVNEATRYCQEKTKSGKKNEKEYICVNISGASVIDENFLEFIVDAIKNARIDPNSFTFEITETTAIENLGKAINFIKKLKALGCTFALDDFGNGFTSFSYLKNLPVDYLKIDGSFVKTILENNIDFALVEAVNSIGHVMGMKTIAEFVENEQIMDKLRDLGVDYGQGYAISKPKPLSDI